MKKFLFIKLLSDLLLGLGFLLTIIPIIVYRFIHADYERTIWIINGPYPFNHFGGGPFQLFMYIGLFVAGVCLITISIILNKSIKN